MQTNKRVLVTGASGFLGNTICKQLGSQGCDLIKLGRSVDSDIVCDLRVSVPKMNERSVDWVIHNAGKAHVVPRSQAESQDFFDVNVTGTQNLLQAFDSTGVFPSAFIFISTVAVYGLSCGGNIKEDQPLNAIDPYGKSKIETEELLTRWCRERKVALIILRLPLIAGKEPPGNLGAMIRAIKKGYYLSIGKGSARKSIVMGEDVARIVTKTVDHPGIYHLTDGFHPSFKELEQLMANQLGKRPPVSIPFILAAALGAIGDIINRFFPGKFPLTTDGVKKITSTLTFDDQKARKVLNWHPQRVLDAFRIS